MFLITGMHRSGTSLVGRVAYEAGMDMGSEDSFYPADRWNAAGYFEQTEVIHLNRKLLHGILGRITYFRMPSQETISKRAERLAAKLEDCATRFNDSLLKDPRFCMTIPAWRQAGAEMEGVVVCLREPIQVARSLKKRNFVTVKYGLKLWHLHNKTLLDSVSDLPVRFVKYGNLFSWDSFKREIEPALGFLGESASDEKLKRIFSKCVDRRLRHNAETSRNYPPDVESLWQDLLERHQSQDRLSS